MPLPTVPVFVDLVLDPMKELGVSQEKVTQVDFIHFSSRGITAIHPNFVKFINLQGLWLNDNKICSIENLVPAAYGDNSCPVADRVHRFGCLRLRTLHLSNNSITSLAGNLQNLRFLEVLLLANNKLCNIEVVSAFLKPLQGLKQLDLFGNPCANEANYREFVIFHHPSICILDRVTVTPAEKENASNLFSQKKKREADCIPYAFGRTIPQIERGMKPQKVSALSYSVRMLEKKVLSIHKNEAAALQRSQNSQVASLKASVEHRSRFSTPLPENDHVVKKVIQQKCDAEKEKAMAINHLRLLKTFLGHSEFSTIKAAFDPKKSLDINDAISVIHWLGLETNSVVTNELGLLLTKVTTHLTLENLFDMLFNWPLLLELKREQLHQQGTQALTQMRGAKSSSELNSIHKSLLLITEHLELLKQFRD